MKKSNVMVWVKVRRVLATAFAFSIVIGVPLLSLNQYGHFFHFDTRKVSAAPAFNARSVDTNSKPYHLFEEPLISVTFDDGWETTYTEAFPVLQKYGIHTTQFVLSGVEKQHEYLNWEQIKSMHDAGHEIGCHSDTHPDFRQIDDEDIKYQLDTCKQKVEERIGKVNSFASPYGSADNRTLTDVSKVFSSQRNTNGDSSNGVTDADVNLKPGFNRFNIIGMTVKRDTSAKEIQDLVDFAVKHNGWLVLTYHQADDGSSKYGLDTKHLDEQMAVLNKSSARVVTVGQAINSIKK
jgi:peptidoglycan/xylan/chitin deacetylase (PgdA/CDA1 family)